jgi:hypothetical protein
MQELQGTHVVSTYHFPGTFSGCLLFLSAISLLGLATRSRAAVLLWREANGNDIADKHFGRKRILTVGDTTA